MAGVLLWWRERREEGGEGRVGVAFVCVCVSVCACLLACFDYGHRSRFLLGLDTLSLPLACVFMLLLFGLFVCVRWV